MKLSAILLAALALSAACAQAQPYPTVGASYPTYIGYSSNCNSTTRGIIACTGQLTGDDVAEALGELFYQAQDSAVTLVLKDANLTSEVVGHVWSHAYKLPSSPSLTIKLENSIIAHNQFVLFGAMVVQSAMAVSVEVVNSRILNNQLTAAAAIAVGSSGTATFSAVGSDIIGNMVSAAGALAISGAAHVRAAGTGGSARENVVQGAGLVASGGPASANADAFSIPGEDNGVWGAGLPFTEQPMVAEVIKTVFDAVFVSSSGLPAGLANVQAMLCAEMDPGRALAEWAYDKSLDGVVSVAKSVLCGASPLKLSDIPGWLDGSASGSMMSLRTLGQLATGNAHIGVKSAWGLARTIAAHPQAASDLFGQLKIVGSN